MSEVGQVRRVLGRVGRTGRARRPRSRSAIERVRCPQRPSGPTGRWRARALLLRLERLRGRRAGSGAAPWDPGREGFHL